MLKRLTVKDFAIIEDVTVDFNDKMTVLTGETGAGKSLLIDTISLLLGSRADTDMIRYGKDKSVIEGIFIENKPEISNLLNEAGIPILAEITILREINLNGKNPIKINGVGVSLQVLKKISQALADIHIQNDTIRLFNPDAYLDFIDPSSDDKFNKLLNSYTKALVDYNKGMSQYEHVEKGQKSTLDRLEYLEYEYNELNSLNLVIDEDTLLEEKINKLKNFDKIFSGLKEAYNFLDGEGFNLDNIYDSYKELSKLSDFDEEYSKMSQRILDSYYSLDEIKNNLYKNINNLDYDEKELDEAIERLNSLDNIKQKYKKSLEELIEYKDKIKIDIDMVIDYDNILNEAKAKVEALFSVLKQKASQLTEYRKKIAINIEKNITKECQDLDLEDTVFKIEFNEVKLLNPFDKQAFLPNGVDTVSFNISFNKGEPVKPLHKIASGGEMSRIMLAFKSYYSKNGTQGLMVFDEIDTGVSGQTAKKIAIKMKEISSYTQVLCITHLPQVASIGDYHKHIYKILEDNRTKTQIKDLTKQERIEEIALMLSGDKLSLYALEHAESLLNENKS